MPDLCHREPEFAELTRRILRALESVYTRAGETHRAVLLSSSGTGAVEAMISTFARRDVPTVVAANGVYGERMESMLRAQGKPVVAVRSDWLSGVDLEALDRALASHPEAVHVAVVHHETTTGRLNSLGPVAALCTRHGCRLLLDAVSSFGGEELDFESIPIDAVAGTANKCLHGVPGAAFVLAERDLLSKPSQSPSLYLDLCRYLDQQVSGYSPFTQPVQSYYALDQALLELQEAGGWQVRRDLYRSRSQRLQAALFALGVETLLDPEVYSSMLTSYRLPEGKSYEEFHRELKEAGFITYAGQGNLKGQVFRLATMGEISESDLDRLCLALKRSLTDDT